MSGAEPTPEQDLSVVAASTALALGNIQAALNGSGLKKEWVAWAVEVLDVTARQLATAAGFIERVDAQLKAMTEARVREIVRAEIEAARQPVRPVGAADHQAEAVQSAEAASKAIDDEIRTLRDEMSLLRGRARQYPQFGSTPPDEAGSASVRRAASPAPQTPQEGRG